MLFKFKSFIHFLIKSTNQHGVHSPFVYNLVTKCFYKKSNASKSNIINKIRLQLLSNNEVITITDFGSGSKVFKNNQRKISDIAKIAGITKKKSAVLVNILEYFNCKNILEIGTSVGLGTVSMSIANSHASITTLEGCKNTAAVASNIFQNNNLKNINIVIGEFDKTLPDIIQNNNFDLVYFDGNHQKKTTIKYFNECLKSIHNNSLFIFDDINWSIEMKEAWLEIIEHPEVSISINTYFWGFIFFRKEQEKEHFTIRI
jgi:predicted O-methyltransferase YrrM